MERRTLAEYTAAPRYEPHGLGEPELRRLADMLDPLLLAATGAWLLRDAASGHHVLLVLARESWILRAVGADGRAQLSAARLPGAAATVAAARAAEHRTAAAGRRRSAAGRVHGRHPAAAGRRLALPVAGRQARMSAASSPRPRIAARPAPSPRTAGHRSRPAIAAPAFPRSRRPRPSRSRWPGRRRAPARDGATGHEPAGNRNEWAICPCRARRAPACLPSRPPAWTAAALAPRTSAARPGRRRGRRPDPGSPPGIRPECATAPGSAPAMPPRARRARRTGQTAAVPPAAPWQPRANSRGSPPGRTCRPVP